MPNDPFRPSRQPSEWSSSGRKAQRVLRAEVLRRLFPLVALGDAVGAGRVEVLTQGEPWDPAALADVPLEPEAVALRSVPTATRPVQAWFVPDALVAPSNGVVLTGRSRRIAAESVNTGQESLNSGQAQDHLLRRITRLRPTSTSGTVSLLFSPGRNYYHTLVDNLARVCAFGLPPLSSTDVELLYDGPLTPVERELLDRLLPPNVSLRPSESKGLVRVEQLVLPGFPAWRYSGWLPPWYRDQLRDALVPDRAPRRSERLYIVRRGSRSLTNERELLERLDRHGFRPVELEGMSFLQQVELFHDAEAVVAAHGAGLTNLLFANRALVVEISPTRFVFPHYAMMSLSLGHQHRFVFGTRGTRWEEFAADVPAVEHELVDGLASM